MVRQIVGEKQTATLMSCIPDLIVGVFDTAAVELMEKAVTRKGQREKADLNLGEDFTYLSLDPTYNVGPFYLTPITFTNIFVKEKPLMISGFYTHTRKDENTYNIIANNFFNSFPQMQKIKLAVTDGERALINAFKPYITAKGGYWIPCFNHKLQDLMLKCNELKLDANYYRIKVFGRTKDTMDGLVDMTEKSVEDAKKNWDPQFFEWFKSCLYDDIKNYMLPEKRAAMNLRKDGKGKITTNLSESGHHMIKEFLKKRHQEDSLVKEMKGFFRQQRVTWVNCCMQKSSDWHLEKWAQQLKIDTNFIFNQKDDSFISTMINSLQVAVESTDYKTPQTEIATPVTAAEQFPIILQREAHKLQGIYENLLPIVGHDHAQALVKRADEIRKKKGGVTLQSSGGSFLVASFSKPGTYYPVTFTGNFPRCENPYCKNDKDKSICSHILAVFLANNFSLVKLYDDLEKVLITNKKQINLVASRDKKRKPDPLTSIRKFNLPDDMNQNSLGRKGGSRRKSYKKRTSIEPALRNIYVGKEVRNYVDSTFEDEEQSNDDVTSFHESIGVDSDAEDGNSSGDEQPQIDDSGDDIIEQNNGRSKKSRFNSSISKEEFWNNIDTTYSTRKETPSTDTLYFLPEGNKKGKLPQCKVCKKVLEKQDCRVVWYLQSKFIDKRNGKERESRVSPHYFCPEINCIQGEFKAGIERKKYKGDKLVCNVSVNEEQLSLFKQLERMLRRL